MKHPYSGNSLDHIGAAMRDRESVSAIESAWAYVTGLINNTEEDPAIESRDNDPVSRWPGLLVASMCRWDQKWYLDYMLDKALPFVGQELRGVLRHFDAADSQSYDVCVYRLLLWSGLVNHHPNKTIKALNKYAPGWKADISRLWEQGRPTYLKDTIATDLEFSFVEGLSEVNALRLTQVAFESCTREGIRFTESSLGCSYADPPPELVARVLEALPPGERLQSGTPMAEWLETQTGPLVDRDRWQKTQRFWRHQYLSRPESHTSHAYTKLPCP